MKFPTREEVDMTTPSIVTPIDLTDDSVVEIRWGDLRRFADAYVSAYHCALTDHDVMATLWGIRFANSILSATDPMEPSDVL